MFLKNLKLAQKFTALLIAIFLIGTAMSGVALAKVLDYSSQEMVSNKALMLMETMNSVRHYTSTEINPELVDRLDTEFLPETVPAYSAREVFEHLRTSRGYQNFFYKEAVVNPTNPRDQADDFEFELIEGFRRRENLEEVSGFRTTLSGELYYIARPISMTEPSCLQCHGAPSDAPATMIAHYGDRNGFGWKLNEVIGAQVISVPADDVRKSARQSFVLIMGIVAIAFATAIGLVNFWLKRFVIRPINKMAQVAEAVSTGDMEAEFQVTTKDEVGRLADAFQRMKLSLALAMKRLERYRMGQRPVDQRGNRGSSQPSIDSAGEPE